MKWIRILTVLIMMTAQLSAQNFLEWTDNGWRLGSQGGQPVVMDIDADGLLDLLVGNYDGSIQHFEQTGIVLYGPAQELPETAPDFPVLEGPYLGQKPPGDIPEIFAPGIVSLPESWEAAVTFSPDGTECFFTRRADIRGSGSDNRLMRMRLAGGRWTPPEPAPFTGQVTAYEAFIAPDGGTIFYNSGKSKPSGVTAPGEIWFSERTARGWSESRYLTETVNRGWVMFVTVSADNTLYFTAGYNGRYGIYRSECLAGGYQEPEYLPPEINALRGAHPFIAPDESFLIFDAQPGGMGKSQLFISFRDLDGRWKPAVRMNDTINATDTENIPNVTPDGKYFFFHRKNDIWWVDAKVLDAYR